MGRLPARAATVAIALLLTTFGTATPALAHTEIELDKARANATDVTMTMTAEAEASDAGISSIQIILPPPITPDKITYVDGPTGWTFLRTMDGYSVTGPALPAHVGAVHRVRISELPYAPVLVMKTMVVYANGQVDRWFEETTENNPRPDHPAPSVKLAPPNAGTMSFLTVALLLAVAAMLGVAIVALVRSWRRSRASAPGQEATSPPAS